MAIIPKKRENKDGSITWWVRLDFGDDPATGVRVRPYVLGETERACRQKAIAELEKHRTGRYRKPDGTTVASFCEQYLTYAEELLAASTMISYRSAIKCYIVPYLGNVKLQEVTEPVIAEWSDWMRVERALSVPTRRAARSKLHRIMEQAREWQVIERNPVTAVKPPKALKRERDFLDEEQTRRLLAATRGHRYEVYFVLGFATGMRRGELLGARWDDLRLHGDGTGEIRVVEQLKKAKTSFARGGLKTPTSSRVIPLPPGVADQLKRFRAKDKAERLKQPGWNPDGYIVTNTKGGHTWPNAIDQVTPRFLAKAGIERFTNHTMRHTYATMLENDGVPQSQIQALLGHASYRVTEIYTHADRAKFGAAVAVLGPLFSPASLGQKWPNELFWPNDGLMEQEIADNRDVVLHEKTAP
jgi:integrase